MRQRFAAFRASSLPFIAYRISLGKRDAVKKNQCFAMG
jgi:hypothetical protein